MKKKYRPIENEILLLGPRGNGLNLRAAYELWHFLHGGENAILKKPELLPYQKEWIGLINERLNKKKERDEDQ